MKPFLLVFLILLTSCDYFQSKKVSTEQLLEEEMQAINWNDVDDYPTFSDCDGANTNQDKKACFESYLHNLLASHLKNQIIVVTEDVSDTIILKIHIDKKGQFSIRNIDMDSMTQAQIPQLDSILRHSFDSLPKIYPAIKRSQQVATEFSLPVIVNIN
ncbi:hypothetical protein [Gelidibacter salicanalis]|uniref:TonB C-terminal domain-containing protein n=1 Tax=Gelidibacter salicanalis TaxID=291193 RepID=A0A934KVB0_9FLAO|nr:hypothetical protein [Gelidibacter salicanalis]MBJ7881493.1 hypothetical protein [Gelidibacter salicanalis]